MIDQDSILKEAQDMVKNILGGIKITGGYGVKVSGNYPSWVATDDGVASQDDDDMVLVTVCHMGVPAQRRIRGEDAAPWLI